MQRLLHYSHRPFGEVLPPIEDIPAPPDKPRGLWFSVEGGYDWERYCLEHEWPLGRYVTEVVLRPGARVLQLRSAGQIDLFTAEFNAGGGEVDWAKVARWWRGVLVAPMCWDRHRHPDVAWYRHWDCACGCVWDPSAVAELRPISSEEADAPAPDPDVVGAIAELRSRLSAPPG